MLNAVSEIVDLTSRAFLQDDLTLARQVEPLEQVIDKLKEEMRTRHILRMRQGQCSIEAGFVWADLLTDLERTSDHCSNIAVAIIEVEHNSFDTHRYLNGVKYGNSVFNEIYDQYAQKYSL